MQPTLFPPDLDFLQRAWQEFMLTSVPTADVDPVIVQSWRRCISRFDPNTVPRLTTLKEPSLTSVLRVQNELMTTAMPFLEDVYQFSEGTDYAILLTDGTGCTLAVAGHSRAIDRLVTLGIGRGTYWAEGQMGTNAFGVVLVEAMPVLVVGSEHYFSVYHHLATAAAPIHDVRGRIIGLMGIITEADQVTSHILSLVMASARAIGNQLHTEWYLKEANLRLREVNTLLGSIAEGVIAWNQVEEITHVNEPAAALLQLNPQEILGHQLSGVLNLPQRLLGAIQSGQELHEAELTFMVNEQAVPCVISLRPIREGRQGPVSYLATLRPVEHIRQMVHRQVSVPDRLTLSDLAARSGEMKGALRLANAAAKGKAPILLRGESGVGKNQLARAIHNASPRADQPFLVINCRAIPHELMLGEFLGHEGDSHTSSRLSKFELAEGGTILLDQIEHLSLEMQAALLQFLDSGTLLRLGGTRPIPVNVRVCAATSASLEKQISEGSFLSRLYYAFGVFTIEIPPLRERTDDIPLLAGRFLTRIATKGTPPSVIEPEVLALLTRYSWPGNVRELESVLERASLNSRNNVVSLTDLPESVRSGRNMGSTRPQTHPLLSVADAEREAIIQVGMACNGRLVDMAQKLGIGRTTLWRKMRQYKLTPYQFKN